MKSAPLPSSRSFDSLFVVVFGLFGALKTIPVPSIE